MLLHFPSRQRAIEELNLGLFALPKYPLTLKHFQARDVVSHTSDITAAKQISRRQKRVLLQCFIICFFIFAVSATYAMVGFVRMPPWLSHSCIVALQIGCGCTSIVYLAFNVTIRTGVKRLLLGGNRRGSNKINDWMAEKTSIAIILQLEQEYRTHMEGQQPVSVMDAVLKDDKVIF